MSDVEVVCADLGCERDRAATLALMDAYSADPMGDARPLSDYARALYGRFGFGPAVYPADAAGGGSLYLVKPLRANETGGPR
jgi:hypothetical protein